MFENTTVFFSLAARKDGEQKIYLTKCKKRLETKVTNIFMSALLSDIIYISVFYIHALAVNKCH